MKIKCLIPFIALCLAPLINCPQLQAKASDGKIKILVLIIDSDNEPVYAKLRKIWRSYMHLDPEHVVAYFIRGNPNLQTQCMINGDTIWTKCQEERRVGVLHKTILSMEYMLKETDFDYVLRPCLSSFYIFPRLLQFLENCPREHFYCASTDTFNYSINGKTIKIPFGCGCGFLLSSDLVKMMTAQKSELWNPPSTCCDDNAIGLFFFNHAVPLISHGRGSFSTIAEWQQSKNNIPADVFQFRVKNGVNRRMIDELYIDSQLLKMFYDISI
jgi:hypothetical protein